MSKLESAVIILSALFCLSQCQSPQAYVDATSSVTSFTAQYKTQPKIVTLKNRLYTVILDYHTINLTSIDNVNDQPQQVLSCKLLTSDALMYDNLYNKIATLGNGKFVLVTPANSLFTSPEEAYSVHLIVDPFDCSSQRIVKVPCQRSDADPYVLALIPYQDSYDVIDNYKFSRVDIREYRKNREVMCEKNSSVYPKNPQRFNDKGEKIQLDYFLKPDSTSEETSGGFKQLFKINTIKAFDASEGYYHTYYTNDKGSVLQRLNSRFEIVKEIRVDDANLHVSATHGHINYCTFGRKTICKLLNSDLEVHATSELPKLYIPKGVYVGNRHVMNLPDHRGLVILLGYKSKPFLLVTSADFYLQRVDTGGSALPYYWKIGNTFLYQYKLCGIVDSGRDFCYVILATNWINGSNFDLHSRCLDLYAH